MTTSSNPEILLKVDDLSVEFKTKKGEVQALRNVSFELQSSSSLGIVGESGSGKSVTSLAIMNLLSHNGRISEGHIFYKNMKLNKASQSNELSKSNHSSLSSKSSKSSKSDKSIEINELKEEGAKRSVPNYRGRDISMIFQDPMTSLNPCFTVEFQIDETLRAHTTLNSKERNQKAIDLLNSVGISEPRIRLKQYPHELSGGMAQRVMIAIAIACSPKVLIADEPTTALDVTIQAQILKLLQEIRRSQKMGLILISHDMGVIAENTEDLCVMYAGEVVERGPTKDIIQSPRHPYTKALLESLPARHFEKERLPIIDGLVPALFARPKGCQFAPRCSQAQERCHRERPDLTWSTEKQEGCFRQGDNEQRSEQKSEPKRDLMSDLKQSAVSVRCFYPIKRESKSSNQKFLGTKGMQV